MRSVYVRSALVAIEVALTVVLLVAAGLMVKSFWHMTAYPPGFALDRVLTMRVQFSGPRYRDPQNQRAFIDEMLRRAAAPGVEAAGVGSNGGAIMLMPIEGGRHPDGAEATRRSELGVGRVCLRSGVARCEGSMAYGP